MEFKGEKLILDDQDETALCQSLYLASFESRPLRSFTPGQEVEGDDLSKILRGASRISLGIEAEGFRGITQETANEVIDYLCGEAPDCISQDSTDKNV